MWRTRALIVACACALICLSLAACDTQPTARPYAHVYGLVSCGDLNPTPTPSAPASTSHPTIYVAPVDQGLRALDAANGALRWCDRFLDPAGVQPPGCASIPCPQPPLVFVGEPLVVAGVAYVCVSGLFNFTYALNAADGTVRWKRATDCVHSLGYVPSAPNVPDDYARPALAHDILYSGSYALNANDGSVLWKLPAGEVASAVADGTLYSYTRDDISAWDATSGAPRWTYALPDPLAAPPTVANGAIYVGDSVDYATPATTAHLAGLFALNAQDGRLLWIAPIGPLASAAVVADGIVYVGGQDTALFALDSVSGAVRWRADTAIAPASTPVVQGGVVYFVAADGAYALDAATGAVRWRQPLVSANGQVDPRALTTPALAQGVLYVNSSEAAGDAALYALNADNGAILWKALGLNWLPPPVAP